MKLQFTERFRREYRRLPRLVKEAVDRRLEQLLKNPRHPSLHFKRIQGTKKYWEVRATQQYRIILETLDDMYLLYRVGPHDILTRL
jgi:mRNA-degrading endonuclease RelE of RelBE toxin-antitoxin system